MPNSKQKQDFLFRNYDSNEGSYTKFSTELECMLLHYYTGCKKHLDTSNRQIKRFRIHSKALAVLFMKLSDFL